MFLGFASAAPGGATNVLLTGYSASSGGSPSWSPVVSDAGSSRGSAAYASGTLEWSMDFDSYVSVSYRYFTTVCSYYFFSSYAFPYGIVGKSFGGAYSQTETIDFDTYGYDLWSFVATDATTYITVDTTDPTTAFDSQMLLIDDTGCLVGRADDTFLCTYAPPWHACPSYELATTKGATYEVMVGPRFEHYATLGDYQLFIDASADPSLTLIKDDVPTRGDWHFTVEGTANIP
jgi:hypothetical protein